MPRYDSQTFDNYDSSNNRMLGGNSGGAGQKRRHNFGKQVLIAGGDKLLGDGLCLRLLPFNAVHRDGSRVLDASGNPTLTQFIDDASDPEKIKYGDWYRLYEVVHFFGYPGCSFIVWDGSMDVDKNESPAWLLFWAAKRAQKNNIGGTLGRLFDDLLSKEGFGSKSHLGSLKAPEPMMFISASQMVVRPDGSIGLAAFEEESRNARVFGMKKTAAQSLRNAINVRADNGDLLCGDLLSLDAAKLVTVMPTGYRRDHKLPRPKHTYSMDGLDPVYVPAYANFASEDEVFILGKPDPKATNAKGSTGVSYSVVLHDHFMMHTSDLHDYEQQLLHHNSTFDEMMYVPSHGEQAEIMADCFPPEALDFAWREHPEYLRLIPTGATTVEVPQAAFTQPTAAPRPVARPATPKPAVTPALEPPAAMNVQDVPASDDFDVAPIGKPEIPPGATIPPPKASAARADVLAKARAAAKRS